MSHTNKRGKNRWLNSITASMFDGICCASYSRGQVAEEMEEPEEECWDPPCCCVGQTDTQQHLRHRIERVVPLHVLSQYVISEGQTTSGRPTGKKGGIIDRYYSTNPCASSYKALKKSMKMPFSTNPDTREDNDERGDFYSPHDDSTWEGSSTVTDLTSNVSLRSKKKDQRSDTVQRSNSSFTYPNFVEGYLCKK